jgi:Ca-activated chloride channel family protein
VAFDVDAATTSAGPAVTRVYPQGTFDLFAGEQVVLVGRYRTSGTAKVTLRGSLAGKEQSFDFPAELVAESSDDTNGFVAKLWATRRVGEIIDELDLKGRNEELVKELVALATEHGILTSYTSFLADENSDVRNLTRNVSESLGELEDLSTLSGAYGVNQRGGKRLLQSANSAPAAAAFDVDESGRRGLDSFQRSKLTDNFNLGVAYYCAERDKQVVVTTVCNVGRKTFFQRSGRWIDSAVSEVEEKQAQKVERFSQEYFDLVSAHGQHVARYLAMDEPVVVKLDGQTYEWGGATP